MNSGFPFEACEKFRTLMCLSSLSTTSIENLALAAPQGFHWFQLYIYKNREITQELVRRAEAANFKALVLTVDTAVLGKRVSFHYFQYWKS